MTSASTGLSGIWAAALTPIDAALQPEPSTALPYYRELLASGCDGLNVLGTTGEAMSLSVAQRLGFMESLACSDLPIAQIMAGTGAASLADAAVLTRKGFECGFAAALVMPPFYFRDARDDGIVAFFDRLFGQADPPAKSVILYNFPRMSGITFGPDLVDRLVDEFPEAIVGIKDSSNDPALQQEIVDRHPALRIFPGSEYDLGAARHRGVAGCISGTVALWPALARAVYDGDDREQELALNARRVALEPLPLIAAVRYLTARRYGDERWERPLPPLEALTKEQKKFVEKSKQLKIRR